MTMTEEMQIEEACTFVRINCSAIGKELWWNMTKREIKFPPFFLSKAREEEFSGNLLFEIRSKASRMEGGKRKIGSGKAWCTSSRFKVYTLLRLVPRRHASFVSPSTRRLSPLNFIDTSYPPPSPSCPRFGREQQQMPRNVKENVYESGGGMAEALTFLPSPPLQPALKFHFRLCAARRIN